MWATLPANNFLITL